MQRGIWAIWAGLAFALATNAARAELRFDATSVNLGEIRAGVPLAHQFRLANAGAGAIEITEVRPGCGCLKPKLTHLRYSPGERGDIAFEVHTLGQAAGPHTWQMTVYYRDGEQLREQVLQVTADVVTEVSVQPAAVTLVGDGPLAHELTLTDLRPRPLAVTGVETTAPWLTARPGALRPDAFGHHTAKVALEVGPACPVGRHAETVVLRTDDALYAELKVTVTVVKREARRVSVTPGEVVLGDVPRLVRLADAQGQPVVVESVSCDQPGVKCQAAQGPDNQATVRVQLDRAAAAPSGQATVRVQLSGPVREVMTIAVRWEN
jgi:hypothetical protein